MTTKNFFDKQSDSTAVKIKILQEYFKGYLPKLLLTFGNCLVADLFCGTGKNGKEDGSALIFIKEANNFLNDKTIVKKQPGAKVYLFFSDGDKQNIKQLKQNISNIEKNDRVIIRRKSYSFDEIFNSITEKLKEAKIPKFFFLDPFSYASFSMDQLRQLMNLLNTEVLFFWPYNEVYRFKTMQGIEKYPSLIKFLQEFTTKGIFDYESQKEFLNSIKEKIKHDLQIDLVRPIEINAGSTKKCLFLLTKHWEGMLLMNQIAWKRAEGGSSVSIRKMNYKQNSLFSKTQMDNLTLEMREFEDSLKDFLTNNPNATNDEIVYFTIKEGFLPRHIVEIFNKCKWIEKVIPISKSYKKGLYISADTLRKNKRFCKFRYKF